MLFVHYQIGHRATRPRLKQRLYQDILNFWKPDRIICDNLCKIQYGLTFKVGQNKNLVLLNVVYMSLNV